MYKTHESKNNFEKLQMSTAIIINPFRGRPLEKTGGGVTIPLKNPAKESCLKEKSYRRWYRKKNSSRGSDMPSVTRKSKGKR